MTQPEKSESPDSASARKGSHVPYSEKPAPHESIRASMRAGQAPHSVWAAVATRAGCVTAVFTTVRIAMWAVRRRRTAGSARLNATLPVNSAWWLAARKKSGDLLYVAVGDSAAQGIGASKPHRGYVGLIADHLRQTTGRTVRVVNLSSSGARLREAIADQLPALRSLTHDGTVTPDVVTVAIGANDIAEFDRDRFERELRVLYDGLPQHSLVADVPAFYFGRAERNARIANEVVHRVAHEHGFEIAPLYARTRRQTGAKTALRDVAADFFHPNDRGYVVWASAFLPLLPSR